MTDDERFRAALRRFDDIHAEDDRAGPGGEPFAVVYHRALARHVEALAPEASVAMRLAARCQHLRRGAVLRTDFPEGTAGYKRWRASLALRHASDARAILLEVGYDEATTDRVADFLLKRGLKKDAEVAAFEDAICLVFLEIELAAFAAKHPDDKVVDILRKTWAKMTPRGHEAATALAAGLSAPLGALVARATTP